MKTPPKDTGIAVDQVYKHRKTGVRYKIVKVDRFKNDIMVTIVNSDWFAHENYGGFLDFYELEKEE